jgi:hypothetical protein
MSRKLLMKLEHDIKSSHPRDLQYAMYLNESKKSGIEKPLKEKEFMDLYEEREHVKQLNKELMEAQRKNDYKLNYMNSDKVRQFNMAHGRMEDKMNQLERNRGRHIEDFGNMNNAMDYHKAERVLEKEHKRNEPKVKERKKKTVI